MAIDLQMKVTPRGLEYLNEDSMIQMQDYANGDFVNVKITKPRTSRCNAFYWAALNQIIASGATSYKNKESLHDAIKFEIGHVEERRLINGKAYYTPKSTAFHKMDQKEFNDYMTKADAVLRKYFGIGFEDAKQWRAA